MKLEISTPSKTLFEGEVRSVRCPGKGGSFQVLNHHAPLVAVLEKGQVKYETANGLAPSFVDVNRGVVQVTENKVTILLTDTI